MLDADLARPQSRYQVQVPVPCDRRRSSSRALKSRRIVRGRPAWEERRSGVSIYRECSSRSGEQDVEMGVSAPRNAEGTIRSRAVLPDRVRACVVGRLPYKRLARGRRTYAPLQLGSAACLVNSKRGACSHALRCCAPRKGRGGEVVGSLGSKSTSSNLGRAPGLDPKLTGGRNESSRTASIDTFGGAWKCSSSVQCRRDRRAPAS